MFCNSVYSVINDCFYIMNKLDSYWQVIFILLRLSEHLVFRELQAEQLHLESLGNLTMIEIRNNKSPVFMYKTQITGSVFT